MDQETTINSEDPTLCENLKNSDETRAEAWDYLKLHCKSMNPYRDANTGYYNTKHNSQQGYKWDSLVCNNSNIDVGFNKVWLKCEKYQKAISKQLETATNSEGNIQTPTQTLPGVCLKKTRPFETPWDAKLRRLREKDDD